MADAMLFRDSAQPLEGRVEDLLGRLTLAEKIGQLSFEAPAIERLGIPSYSWWNEALHGVGRAGQATVFPQAIGMAASFHPELLQEVASAISDEARAKHREAERLGSRLRYMGLTLWSPNINIFRDPRWGRGQETYGECPYLTSRLGVAFIRGIQGDDPGRRKCDATAKHFAAHSGPEEERHGFDARVSPRDLHETYLPAFKSAVQEAKVAAVMGAYNRLNGEVCCGSKTLLADILRSDWGFDGYVVSDCGAVCDFHEHHRVTRNAAESAALALGNGCDLCCGVSFGQLAAAVETGLVTEAGVDAALRRLLAARFRLGMLDEPARVPFPAITPGVVHCEAHVDLARRMARESIVLARNEGGVLPLRRDLKCIAVVGPAALDHGVLVGNYSGYSSGMVTLLEGITGAVSVGTKIDYWRYCDFEGGPTPDDGPTRHKLQDSEVIIACMGLTPDIEGEQGDAFNSDAAGDRLTLTMPGHQEKVLKMLHATGRPVILVLTGGCPQAITWAAENLPAILIAWYPGEQGGNAVADILFGAVSPSGRLPVTFVRSANDLPPFCSYDMAGRTYRFMSAEPLFPFGFGLSYSSFEYSDLGVSPESISDGGTVRVAVTVRNTGTVPADEVVQLYVSDLEASVRVPIRNLRGIKRVSLQPGESRRIEFTLGAPDLFAYDEDGVPFVEAGRFAVSVGGCQPDARSAALGGNPGLQGEFSVR